MQNKDDALRERMLVESLRRGSREAFDAIYRRYAARLTAYCMAYTKNAEAAKEIVQETFIKLWDKRATLNSRIGAGALLFTMAKNRIIDAFRHHLSDGTYEDYLRYADVLVSADTTASKIEYSEFVSMLRKAIALLPQTQRKVITLCRLEGLSVQEAAASLGLSEQTVKNSLSLGLKQLYRHITYNT